MDLNWCARFNFSITISSNPNSSIMVDWNKLKERLVFKDPPKGMEGEPALLTDILYEAKQCDDCERIIDTKRVVEHKLNANGYWSTHCKICKFYKNPATGEFDCDIWRKNTIIKQLKSRKG